MQSSILPKHTLLNASGALSHRQRKKALSVETGRPPMGPPDDTYRRPYMNKSTRNSRDSSTSMNASADSIGFDFDEVVAHFPSPRLGLSGSSPHRWSGGSQLFSTAPLLYAF